MFVIAALKWPNQIRNDEFSNFSLLFMLTLSADSPFALQQRPATRGPIHQSSVPGLSSD